MARKEFTKRWTEFEDRQAYALIRAIMDDGPFESSSDLSKVTGFTTRRIHYLMPRVVRLSRGVDPDRRVLVERRGPYGAQYSWALKRDAADRALRVVFRRVKAIQTSGGRAFDESELFEDLEDIGALTLRSIVERMLASPTEERLLSAALVEIEAAALSASAEGVTE